MVQSTSVRGPLKFRGIAGGLWQIMGFILEHLSPAIKGLTNQIILF